MGCICDLLCPSKKRPVIDMAPGPTNNDLELKTPLKTEENESGNADLEAKKELALYLVKNDNYIFNRCLKTVEKLERILKNLIKCLKEILNIIMALRITFLSN